MLQVSVFTFWAKCGPYIFIKIIKPVVSYLRNKGFTSIIYLDDIVLFWVRQACEENIEDSVSLVESLGFIIDYHKSSLKLTQQIEFLGTMYDFKKIVLELSEDQKQKIVKLLERCSPEEVISLR